METPLQERLYAGLGTAIIVALLGYALLLGLSVSIGVRPEQAIALLDLRSPPPPPPLRRPPVEHPRSTKASGAASPRNLRNKATPVVAPVPIVRLPPPPPPLVIAPKPGTGMAASNGASNRPGPGQGAGGAGDGTGSGGDGDGDGGGIAPRQIAGRLKGSDLPLDMIPIGTEATVGVRYRVEIDGRVSDCRIARSSGNARLDALTCQLIQKRFRFDPSRDETGQKTWAEIIENHTWSFDHDGETPAGH